MPSVLTPDQVREFDRLAAESYGLPGRILMENAGRGVAESLLRESPGKVAILCGKGNNGGDGFVIARHLDARGVPVRVIAIADEDAYSGDAAANYACLRLAGIPVDVVATTEPLSEALANEISSADWIVDALLGIGASGSPRAPADVLIQAANAASAHRLAVDIPSGLDAATGEIHPPTFQAHRTCTMAASKPGLTVSAAASHVGEVEVIDLGAPRALRQRFGLE